MSQSIIAEYPPQDGQQWDCQCARCGSSVITERCEECEDGFDGHECGEDVCVCLYPDENVPCQYCRGTGFWRFCCSSAEFCKANPLEGRESVERGSIEWFVVKEPA